MLRLICCDWGASILIFIKSAVFCFSSSFIDTYILTGQREPNYLPSSHLWSWRALLKWLAAEMHTDIYLSFMRATLVPPTVISKLISCTDSPRVPAVASSCQGMKLAAPSCGRRDEIEKRNKAQNTISNLTPSLTSDEPWSGTELMPDLDTSQSGRKLSCWLSESFRP